MKAYLKGNDGTVFTLAPKVTTIGRESCDINLQVKHFFLYNLLYSFMNNQ